jgi:3-deoxy-D-manno-octulosonic-acid transferase
MAAALELTRDPARRNRMGGKAREFVAAHRGATARLLAWLEAARDASRAPGPG